MRLFQLHLKKEKVYLLKNMPYTTAAQLAYNQLPEHPIIKNYGGVSFKEDLLYSVFSAVFVDGRSIRTAQAFEQSVQQNKGELISFANSACHTAIEIMERYAQIKIQLKLLGAMAQDIHQQLNYLMYSGFIRNTPYAQLKHFLRYLKAIEYRLEKRDSDTKKLQEINRFSLNYWKQVEKKAKKDIVIPERDAFRWMLEEFRVSLFAQQLKTPYPVSANRLEKAWNERQ